MSENASVQMGWNLDGNSTEKGGEKDGKLLGMEKEWKGDQEGI